MAPGLWLDPAAPRIVLLQAFQHWYQGALADAVSLDCPEAPCRCTPPASTALPPPHWHWHKDRHRAPTRNLVVQVRPFQRCLRHSRPGSFR
jgi:hypothetical protein